MKGTAPEHNNISHTSVSFEAIYHEYSDALFRFCMSKVSDREIALDLTQETFIRAWHYFSDESKEVSHVRGLLYRIARNSIIDFHRKKKTDSLDSLLSNGLDIASPKPADEKEVSEHDYHLLRHALRDLKDSDAELLIMRYVDGLSVNEIASILETQPNTISVRIHRALKQAQEHIDSDVLKKSFEE